MSTPVGDFEEQPVILCVTASRSKRAQVARLMSGHGVVLMFPDLQTVRAMLLDQAAASAAPETGVVALGRLVVDQQRQQVSWAGRALPLTRLERDVLAALASPPLRVWTYQQLYERVWGADYLDDAAAVRSTVKRLRAKLREANASVAVESARGVGYSLVDATVHGRISGTSADAM
ncbi:winged helix-turn-helix domain-containing protein [Micromonospora sp. DR5-3]|uniref:winged helix-turn-helix domain-containing protein n=1 Tax=unclassified Micromonospora TaxID=2617518 RepID=UPI0016521BF1|nr:MULTISPECIES: winged helix-turn-helix domain-containing protein [unclassified Micromonospora]MCW3818510.1 winged helix-turn-helix domain-containing protein [Micromonospora sp. DR5-3]